MKDQFYSVSEDLFAHLKGEEALLCRFSGEESDFVRLNHSAIRQAGTVHQGYLYLDLRRGKRHAEGGVNLTGGGKEDAARARRLLARLRDALPGLPEDPHLVPLTGAAGTEEAGAMRLPDSGEAVEEIIRAGAGRDLVGIYAAGGMFSGVATSLGQRSWHAAHSFHFDWSLYAGGDKAVKSRYAGFEWERAVFSEKMAEAARQLEFLARPPRTIPPGKYKVYLSPAAVGELWGMVNWRGFGTRMRMTKQSALLRMAEGGARLHPEVSLEENVAGGIAPSFQEQGYPRPDRVPLITGGALAGSLTSPRSAQEFGVPANGASDSEAATSLEMAGGALPSAAALGALEKGIYINDLWYLNYSNPSACRITGLTRFASFWVEGGEIQAPLSVMRFDDTLYNLLGENLLAITREREFIPSAGTYGARSNQSVRMPGALIENFSLTL